MECQSIGNLITSSTRYDIPFLDNYFCCFAQNNDYFWVEKKHHRFLAKNRYISWTFFAVTWSKMD